MKQHRTRNKNLVIRISDQESEFMTTAKERTGLPKQVSARKALGLYFWQEHGLLYPGYVPDECHLCSFPMSQHDLIPASATEPGEYRCPTLDDDELPY